MVENINLDDLEEIIKREKQKEANEGKPKKETTEERSRSKSDEKHHHRHSGHHNRNDKSGRHRSHHRSREKEKRKEKEPLSNAAAFHKMTEMLEYDPQKAQQELLKKQIEDAKKQAEEAQRDDCTVLVQRLHLKATEKELFKFFTAANVGKVRDACIIRDQRSGKSKGVGYVEFYNPESVLMATSLSGQKIMSQEVFIQASQAEKNRAAAAIKFKKDLTNKPTQKAQEPSEGAMRIYVGGLAEAISKLTEDDVLKLFSPFGPIEYIDLQRDQEGKPHGFAYIQYKKMTDAKEAMKKMNGFNIEGKTLKVGNANEKLKPSIEGEKQSYTQLDKETVTYVGSSNRHALMSKLARKEDELQTGSFSMIASNLAELGVTNVPSHCLVLTNLFDPKQNEGKTDSFNPLDIKDDVYFECNKFGPVEQVYVDEKSNGNVFLRYANNNIEAAVKAKGELDNRYFGGRRINVGFILESVFKSKVNY